MSLKALEVKKSMLLAELATETVCDFYASRKSSYETHLKSCSACQRKQAIGKEYERVMREIKQAQGRKPNPGPTAAKERQLHPEKYYRIAADNGVSRKLFRARLKAGLSYEEAANTPIQGSRRRRGKK